MIKVTVTCSICGYEQAEEISQNNISNTGKGEIRIPKPKMFARFVLPRRRITYRGTRNTYLIEADTDTPTTSLMVCAACTPEAKKAVKEAIDAWNDIGNRLQLVPELEVLEKEKPLKRRITKPKRKPIIKERRRTWP